MNKNKEIHFLGPINFNHILVFITVIDLLKVILMYVNLVTKVKTNRKPLNLSKTKEVHK